jgi:hypothetical protein
MEGIFEEYFSTTANRKAPNGSDVFAQLRQVVDGSDSFMTGCKFLKERKRRRYCPEWVKSDRNIRELLQNRFPHFKEGCLLGAKGRRLCKCVPCRHRFRAGLWSLVIIRYLRCGESCKQVAFELNQRRGRKTTPAYVRRIAQMTTLAWCEVRLDGKDRSFGKPGRPRKSTCTLATSYEETTSSATPMAS